MTLQYIPVYVLILIVTQASVFGQQTDQGWIFEAKTIDPASYYGVTLANGTIGVTSSPFPLKHKETILNGTSDYYGRGRVSNIVRAFDFLNAEIFVDGIYLGKNEMENFQQTLDVRKATLYSKFTHWKKCNVTYATRALRHLPHSAMVDFEITALEDLTLTIQHSIGSPDILRDVKNTFQFIDRPHASFPLMTSAALTPSGLHTLAASTSFIFSGPLSDQPRVIHEDWDYNSHQMRFTVKLKAGSSFSFAIVGSVISSQHVADPTNEAERLTIFAALQPKARLIQQHEDAWAELWESDIKISGDLESQKRIRLCLYNLYASVREGTSNSVSPMGLSGLGYNGHVFWDSEMWTFPALLQLHPKMARSLLEYRYERLEAARSNAQRHGYRGAMFPWESDHSGQESTPVWALTGPFQHHISADISIACWKYFQVTHDTVWLQDRGFPIMKEVAEFILSRVTRDKQGAFHINNVVAADEFAENVDDNAFTNGSAIEALLNTASAAIALRKSADPRWKAVASKIVILRFPDQTTREHATYNGETIKQCDVNLLSFPLHVINDKASVMRDLKYYETRIHPYGPAMSHSVFAILHARNGDAEKALELFNLPFEKNCLPPFGVLAETAGGTNPFFLTGAGGLLQTVLNGFGGLEITDHGLVETGQHRPKTWRSLVIESSAIVR